MRSGGRYSWFASLSEYFDKIWDERDSLKLVRIAIQKQVSLYCLRGSNRAVFMYNIFGRFSRLLITRYSLNTEISK
jgi:hypothetical protein